MDESAWICEIDGCANKTDHSCCLCSTDACKDHRHFVDTQEDMLNGRKFERYVCNNCYDTCMIAYKNEHKE